MSACLFCNIVSGEIPTEKLVDTETVVAFRDINPQAPTHILVIPKKHIASVADADAEDTVVLGELIQTAKTLAVSEGIDETGYRLIMNTRDDGGQTVHHIHLHVLGGRQMQWPPG